MSIANKIIFGDNLVVTDEGSGTIRVDGVASSGGGDTQTATLTTDSDTFDVSHIFDLGGNVHTVLVTMTCVSVVADGETFGTDAGQLVAEVYTPILGIYPGTSLSGTPGEFVKSNNGQNGSVPDVWLGDAASNWFDGGIVAPGQSLSFAFISFRYLLLGAKLFVARNGDDYEGANHPTMTVRFDVFT